MKALLLLFSVLVFTVNPYSQWTTTQGPVGSNAVIHSLIVNDDIVYAGFEYFGIVYTTNEGAYWEQTRLGFGVVGSMLFIGDNFYAGCIDSGISVSTDFGESWSRTPLNNKSVKALVRTDNYVYAGTNYGVLRSTDNGVDWQKTFFNDRNVYSLAVKDNFVFAGTVDLLNIENGLYVSSDNGEHFAISAFQGQDVKAISVVGNKIYAGTEIGLFESVDNGASWTPNSLAGVIVYSFAAFENNIVVGTHNTGVYVSTDNGTSWIQRNEGLPSLQAVNSLTISGNYMYAALQGGGVRKRPLDELVGITFVSNEVPNGYNLFQNYPNPFNPATNVKFLIPKSGFALLKIYDGLGNEISTLVNEQLNPGTYELNWDASNYPSGIYFYKLVAGDFTETKKMVLIK